MTHTIRGIGGDDVAKLIMTVEEMADREKWLQARRQGIGGSDASVIVGMNPWKSPFTLWMEKTGHAEPEDMSDNERVYWGNVLEETVAREFTKRTGKEVRRRGLMQHCKFPWMLASVDRMLVHEDAGLECKTASSGQGWKDDGLPDAYYVQCQHYMAVTGCRTWYIAALIGGNRFIWKEIPRNDDDIKALLKAETEFWRKVEAKEMPDVDGSESCAHALTEKFHGGAPAIELPSSADKIFSEIDTLTDTASSILAQIEEKKNQLRMMLGDAEAGTTASGRRVTWKTQAGRTTIDSKRLKAERPDVWQQYSKVGNPTRVLKIAG